MSNLPDGAFITSIEGKRCTAIPRNRRAAPSEASSSSTTATTTQPQPTQDSDGGNEDENRDDDSGQTDRPEPTEAPAETSASGQDEDDEAASSESTEERVIPPSESTSESQDLPFTTSTSTSGSPLATALPETDESEEQEDESPEFREPDDPSTSSEPSVSQITPEAEATPRPGGLDDGLQRMIELGTDEALPGQVPTSSSSLLVEATKETTSSSVVISTATLLAGLTSLASPSASSFFFASTPPFPSDQTPAGPLPSSFTSLLLTSPSVIEDPSEAAQQRSDSSEDFTDTTAFPDELITSTVGGTITTIGLASSSARDQDGATETTAAVPGGGVPQASNEQDDSAPNPALVGGIVGGIVGLALMALLAWCCMRRRKKKQNSPRFSPRFSTRMSMPPGAEKRKTYEFDNGSVGPTPRREKFAAAFGYHVKHFGSRFGFINGSRQAVNMNRGNSQFMEGLPSHSRQTSSASQINVRDLSAKERFLDWWSRLKADVNFNWRLRNGHADNWAIRNMMEKDTGDFDPDFMALLNKDEKRALHRSLHSRDQSITSIDRFLGDLGMDLNNEKGPDPNPFSDYNAVAPPKTTAQSDNPFTDAAAVATQRPPQTYVAKVRRSRGTSINNGIRASNLSGGLRDSVHSHVSFETRRNKCRSDPFDLELDHRKLPSTGSVNPMPEVDSMYGLPPRPGSMRKDNHMSGTSSRYTRTSLGDWSDPGPDVGRPDTVGETTISWASKPSDGAGHKSQPSDGSQNSKKSNGIGKAV